MKKYKQTNDMLWGKLYDTISRNYNPYKPNDVFHRISQPISDITFGAIRNKLIKEIEAYGK